MLKPWHIKSLWFKAVLQDVLLEGQKSLTVVQWQQMCSMCVSPAPSSMFSPAALPFVTPTACISAATTTTLNKATWQLECGAMKSGGCWLTVRDPSARLPIVQRQHRL
jgi:hypothetical protein